MLKRTLADCREFVAGDHTVLRELMHPAKEAAALGDMDRLFTEFYRELTARVRPRSRSCPRA